MSHYFENDQDLKSEEFPIDFSINDKSFRLISDLGVFSKDELDIGTFTLIKSCMSLNLKGDILDLGCGIGTVGIVLKSFYNDLNIDFVDVNKRALNLSIKNIDNYKLKNCNVFYSDAYSNITKKYDFILTNPPIRAGKETVDEFVLNSYDFLKENGVIVVVMRKSHGAPSMKNKMNEKFNNCEIIMRNKGFYILKSIKL